MPLPDRDQQWPPTHCHAAQRLYDTWGAWYSGDTDRLAAVYGATSGFGMDLKGLDRPAQYRGGLVGKVARWFWGTPVSAGQLRDAKVHIPIAADIAETSADLLFGEPPQITVDDGATQDRLAELIDELALPSYLLESAEVVAAYGGGYLRVSWDTDLADHPLVDTVPADAAAPEWWHGRLAAVTFWRVLHVESEQVWRHLERHEPGRVFHGLYRGTTDRLGRAMPLPDHPDTAPFAEMVDDEGGFATGVDGLLVVYVPNMRPHRVLRGSPLGRSDYQGVEPVMDALDEAWTSWMRDLRLAKARIVVPDAYLQSQGRGRGAYFDAEQEVYSSLSMLPKPDASGSMITQVQFNIRVAEHQQTTQELVEQIVRGAGYSAQTFGEQGEVAMTATEAIGRERRSFTTRARKINYWRPALRTLVEILLQVDRVVFESKIQPGRPDVEWPDGVADNPESTARTLQMLQIAQAASVETRVRMLHPDWDSDAVENEVARIAVEFGVGVVADPETFRPTAAQIVPAAPNDEPADEGEMPADDVA